MERCSICNRILHRTAGTYAQPSQEGRSPERFFGRPANRKGTKHQGVFDECPWGHEGETAVFCYECHEELLHNPVLLPEEIALFAEIAKRRGLSEESKSEDRARLAGRITLLHEVISKGLKAVANDSDS